MQEFNTPVEIKPQIKQLKTPKRRSRGVKTKVIKPLSVIGAQQLSFEKKTATPGKKKRKKGRPSKSIQMEVCIYTIIISPDVVWGYIGFGLVALHLHPQVTCKRDNSKTNVQNFMKITNFEIFDLLVSDWLIYIFTILPVRSMNFNFFKYILLTYFLETLLLKFFDFYVTWPLRSPWKCKFAVISETIRDGAKQSECSTFSAFCMQIYKLESDI